MSKPSAADPRKHDEPESLAIIGSGPAGYTAAIYAARAGLTPVLIEGLQRGGQLTITTEVENFPGFPEGIQGPELMERCRKQAARLGARLIENEVTKVDLSSAPFHLTLADGRTIEAKSVIIATGAKARWLGLPSEKALLGRGVSACATCDGFFFKDQHVAIVGGGDTAMEEALFLSKLAGKVTIIHRRNALRASKILQERVRENPKIEIAWSSVVKEILGGGKSGVTGVRLSNVETNETTDLACQGVFVAIGHEPSTALFEGQVELREDGYVKLVEPGTTRTSVGGVFVAGDAGDSRYRQAITAAGSGCAAALDAQRYLEEKG